jgi:hypothetical protein
MLLLSHFVNNSVDKAGVEIRGSTLVTFVLSYDLFNKARGCTVLVGRTLEQQGREDDEGKGWRLAVDAKSDLC